MFKRTIDIVVAVSVGLLAAPLWIAVSVAVRIRLGRPVLFVQERPGLRGEPFEMTKFRTMRSLEYPNQPDNERTTEVGGWLRSSSLDELPELWNVVRGDMSLVGPRPLLVEYLELYSHEQARRHEVKPGITGLAQVLGRNDTTWERRLELDVWYVDNQTIWLDLKILAMTISQVLRRQGISAEGHATMPRFEGTEDD